MSSDLHTSRRFLHEGWRVRELSPRRGAAPDWLPAEVPGHVHLDLMRAGVIPDPSWRLSERGCAWVDETDWVYETEFHVDEQPRHAFLTFHGLDTIAEVHLNGELLGTADNMFIPHRFSVGTEGAFRDEGSAGPRLREGSNTLRVAFQSALRTGRQRREEWEAQGNETLNHHPFVWAPRSFVRKAQYMFGWDWGPALVSCGIWKPVELITVPLVRIASWRHSVEMEPGGAAVVRVWADVERAEPGDSPLELRVSLKAEQERGLRPAFRAEVSAPLREKDGLLHAEAVLRVENPSLWWPNGSDPLGDVPPALYYLDIGLHSEGAEVDRLETVAIGLRTLELDTEDGFRFRVNGEELFVKGANWIPADSFPGRLEKEWEAHAWTHDDRLNALVDAAKQAGINMLRVWGGGLYESDHFYALCTMLGILVWQDFPYACAYYPDSGEYAEAARVEAEAAARRLRNHTSLALWCGNNECHMMWHDHWEGEPPAARFVGERLYHEILPEVVAREDPGRPWWPGSPYGGEDPNSEETGDRHNWNVWHGEGDWIHYGKDRGRFLSEFGFVSSCGLRAWEGCLADSDRHPHSPAVRWHDKTGKGYDRYLDLVRLHFPDPQTLEDLVYYSQLNQAEALKRGIEHFRRSRERCGGTLFWQLNDCWPAHSWSVLDSALEPKAAYFAVRRAYAPVLLSLTRDGDRVEAHLTNDLRDRVQGEVVVTIESFDGDVLRDETFEALVEARSSAKVGEIDISAVKAHARDVYVYASFQPYWEIGAGSVESFHFLAEPRDLRFAGPDITVSVCESGEDVLLIRLTAKRFAPFLWWRIDGATCALEHDNHFHLRAGRSREFLVMKQEDTPSADALRSRLRIRTLR